MLRFSDARNFGRTVTGLCLIAGPLLLLVAQLVSPNIDHDNKRRELAALAAHKSAYLTGITLFFVAALIVMGASLGLIRFFRGSRGVTLGQVSGTLLLFGSAATMAFYAFGLTEYEMVNQKAVSGPFAQGVLATFLKKTEDSNSGLPLFIVFLVGIVIGLVLLAVAVWRTRATAVWAAPVILAAGICSFFDSRAVSFVSFGLLIIGFGALAFRILGMSDEEWDTPRDRKQVTGPEPAAPTPAPAA